MAYLPGLIRTGLLLALLTPGVSMSAEESSPQQQVAKDIEFNMVQAGQAYHLALELLSQPQPQSQDVQAALERAAQHGHPIAALMLARMYEEGRGTAPDRERALYWYWSSIGFAFIQSGSLLDTLFNETATDIPASRVSWHRSLAERALALEGLTLATRTGAGLPDVGKLDEGQVRIREILRAAASANTLTGSPAWRIEAVRPKLEQAPLFTDTEEKPNRERRKALNQLAEKGNVNAAYELGLRQLHSTGLFAKPKEGLALLEKVSETSIHARLELGIFELERKDGNPERAFTYLKKSRDLPVAPYILGLQFQKGLGTEANPRLASAMFDQALTNALVAPRLVFNSERARPTKEDLFQFEVIKTTVFETFNLLVEAGNPPGGAVTGGKFGPLDQELELANRSLERIPIQKAP